MQELRDHGRLFVVPYPKSQERILFCPDKASTELVDASLVDMWHETTLEGEDLDKMLKEVGLTPARRVVKWQKPAAVKKRKPRQMRYAKAITNVHMPELFEGKQPDAIH